MCTMAWGATGRRAMFMLILAVAFLPSRSASCFAFCTLAVRSPAEKARRHLPKPCAWIGRRLPHGAFPLLSLRRGGQGKGRQRCSMAAGEEPARSVPNAALLFPVNGVDTVLRDGAGTQYDAAGWNSEGIRPVPWTHFLEMAALRNVGAVSPAEERLAEWRAGSLAADALQNGRVQDGVSFQTHKQQVLNGMRWERVLAAEIGVGLKLSLWKSQARARRLQTDWSVRNAILSLDFERSAANIDVLRRDEANDVHAARRTESARGRRHVVPEGREAHTGRRGEEKASRGGKESSEAIDRKSSFYHRKRGVETNRILNYVREMARTEEDNALIVGKKLLGLMRHEGVSPTTIFFNALLGACTGKSVAKGVGFDGSRGRCHLSTCAPPARGAAFTVRRRASTGAARAQTAAGREAHERWGDCSEALRLMNRHAVLPDATTLNIIVDACVKQGGLGRSEAAHIENGMRILDAFSESCGIVPDVVSYTSLLSGCASALRDSRRGVNLVTDQAEIAEVRLVKVASRIMDRMVAEKIMPNPVTYTAALDMGVHVILRSRHGSRAQLLARDLCQDIIVAMRSQLVLVNGDRQHGQMLTYALNVVLRALLGQGEAESDCEGSMLALEVVDFLLEEGAVPDIISYNTLLHRLFLSCQKPVQGPDNGGSRQFGNTSLLNEVVAHDCLQQIQCAKELLSKMYECGVPPDVATYTTLLNICAVCAQHRASFVECTRLICAAMRCSHIKPNTATSTAFAAGLLTVSDERTYKVSESEDARREVRQAHHAIYQAVASMSDSTNQMETGRNGPGAAELMRAMLALNMRPDSLTATALLRATASGAGISRTSNSNTLKDCVRLIEAMRGAGAVPCRNWYLKVASSAGGVTEGLYLAHLSERHLRDSGARRVVCEKLVRSFCRRRDFDGIAQGWAIVLSQRAEGQPLSMPMCTVLLEAALKEGSTTSAKLSLDLVAAIVDDDSSGKRCPRIERAKVGLMEVLQSAEKVCDESNDA